LDHRDLGGKRGEVAWGEGRMALWAFRGRVAESERVIDNRQGEKKIKTALNQGI